MKFIHAADIHLDSPLHGLERYEGAPVDEIRNATRRAFDNLIDLAIDEEIDFVLLAGDLYDGDWKDYNTGLYFVKCMARLHKANIRVFIVAGNHDADSQITKQLALPDNVKTFSTRKPEQVILDDLAVSICGQGYAKRSVLEDISQGYPQGDPQLFNIGLLHTCLDGKPGHEPYAPCKIHGLRSKGYQYWALGHIHKREVVSENPWIVFPGNTQGRHIRETGAKGCTLVTVENAEITAVCHRDLDVLRWSECEVDLTDTETIEEVNEKVYQGLQQAVDSAEDRLIAIRLVLGGACSVHTELHAEIEYWTQEYRAMAISIAGGDIWLEKVLIKTKPSVSIDDLLERDDALSGMLGSIHAMELNGEFMEQLKSSVLPLRNKLPHEILTGEDSFDPTDDQQLKEALLDIKELLVNRLLMSEDI